MNNATELLESYGVSFSQGKAFIYANLNNPQLIYDTALQYGLTFEMLAELAGQGVTETEVAGFFNSLGFQTLVASLQGIDPSDLATQSYTVSDVIDLASSNTPFVDSLLSGSSWSQSSVTYGFPSSMPSSYYGDTETSLGWRALNDEEIANFIHIASLQNQYINTDLMQANSNPKIKVSALDMWGLYQEETEAYAFFPGNYNLDGDIFLNRYGTDNNEYYYEIGGFGLNTMAHELGHAMGLEHPHEGTLLESYYDNNDYTIMSYNRPGSMEAEGPLFFDDTYTVSYADAYRTELGIFDVAALQAIYGADMNTNAGDTVYIYNEAERAFETASGHYHTIWDAGGNDTLDLSDAKYASTIDLYDYTVSSVSERTSYEEALDIAYASGLTDQSDIDYFQIKIDLLGDEAFLNHNNLGIAYGVVIENVITGAGDDYVLSNDVDNQIYTGSGDDTIYLRGFGGGYDYVDGGEGNDTVELLYFYDEVERFIDNEGYHLLADGFAATLVGVETIEYLDVIEYIV